MGKIRFQVEIKNVIKLLSNDIYDSPYALLRENVQNAYDAILMRKQKDTNFSPKIAVFIDGKEISISDNGIGMTRDVVENNYWKAGSSGKNNEEARKAGVVGTFGIGAMANFGVCEHLKVSTHYLGGNNTIISQVHRDNLDITTDCIDIDEIEEEKGAGTTINAKLDVNSCLIINEAAEYLKPYVEYLEVPVLLNGKLISQKELSVFKVGQKDFTEIFKVKEGSISFDIKLQIQKHSGGNVTLFADNLIVGSNIIGGGIFLEQGKNYIFGLRNFFGLAVIPVNSIFNLGGIVNLPILQPTAGREALSRESVEFVSKLINIIEKHVAEKLAQYDICDSNRFFLNYIYSKCRYDLAGKIKVQILPHEEYITLDKIDTQINNKKVLFYLGQDTQIVKQYSNENNYLLVLSRENPRKSIQNKIIQQKGIELVSDSAQILKVYTIDELTTEEFALTLRITTTLKDDYLLGESKVHFADISHNIPNMVELKNDLVHVYLSRISGNLMQVLKIYEQDYNLFDGFVKDYIRNYLYPQLAPFVPSSTKQGADALYRILQKNKELYTIESEDRGEIESLLKEYLSGKIEFSEVLKTTRHQMKSQTQTVHVGQIGTIEQELSTIISQRLQQTEDGQLNSEPNIALPPIKLLSNDTKKKMLKTEVLYTQLNNFTMFLALSDKIHKQQLDFFLEPHTTKVIWGMHKIVYIFTHASGKLTMYYDIELKDRLSVEMTGGKAIRSTTIISKNKIFVPLIPELISYFDMREETLSFYVRYDTISDLEIV